MAIEKLTEEYGKWLKQSRYPSLAVEDLHAELAEMFNDSNDPAEKMRLKLDMKWLLKFMRRWEAEIGD